MNWSSQQEAIFDWFAKPSDKHTAVIIARAGCGKTTTAVEGFRRAPESRKRMLAYNKRAATDIQDRIGKDGSTFHSLGYAYMMAAWPGVKMADTRAWKVAEKVSGTAPQAIIALVVKLASFGKLCAPLANGPEDLIPLAEEYDLVPDEAWSDNWSVADVAALAYKAMLAACERDGTMDFDDQLYLPVRLKLATPRFDLVVVDEAQDCNPVRILLAQRSLRKGGRIAYVGDDMQAINGWNGADSGVLGRIAAQPATACFSLTMTYRCSKAVVASVNHLVPDYQAAQEAPDGKIETLLLAKLAEHAQPNSVILSRKNAPLASVCLSMLKLGKPAKIAGKDFGAQLVALVKRLAGKGQHAEDLPRFLERLEGWRVAEIAKLPKDAPEQRAETICDKAETIAALAEDLLSVPELVARIQSLFEGDDRGFILCSTVHKAKGLEWTSVYRLESTFYPGKCRQNPTRYAEERNIDYVASTRIKGSGTLYKVVES